jgi:hypothetical protein
MADRPLQLNLQPAGIGYTIFFTAAPQKTGVYNEQPENIVIAFTIHGHTP